MRAPLLALLLLATPATAQDLSATIARDGLAATEARLAAATTPEDRFALGGVRFLRAVERVLQLRWQTGVTEDLRILPVFRLPLDENPTPAPFDPGVIATAFRGLAEDMALARAPLTDLPPDEFAVTIRLEDLWFDVNANTTRDSGESLLDIAGPILLGWQWQSRDPATPAPTVTFDRADADWLRAYTHLWAALAEVVLAYDPTAAIAETVATRAALRDLRAVEPGDFDMSASFEQAVSAIYAIARALDQTPDAVRLAAARDHLLAMIAANRDFWAAVDLETDDAAEWLPNARQTSALGITLPPETGAVWQGLLGEFEAVLTGTALVPYLWLDDSAGVNVARLFTDPAPIDLLGWIEGTAALPYLEKGRVITPDAWRQFEAMMGGQAMLMTLWLN
jgi:hypothetical protein